jgi:lipopolysaccharide export system permease protein
MSILTRYILSELAKVFTMALIALTLLWLVVVVARQAADESLAPAQILQLLPFLAPDVLRFTLPFSALFAVSTVYGRMSASNEVVAAKALGVHPFALILPMLFSAWLLSLVAVVMNDLAVSWGRDGIQRVVMEGVEQIAYGMLERNKTYSNPRFSITVKGVRDRMLVLPTVIFQGEPPIAVTAESAELRADPDTHELTFILRNGSATAKGVRYLFDYEERQVSLQSNNDSNQPSRIPLRSLPDAMAHARTKIREFDLTNAAHLGFDMLTGDFGDLTDRQEMLGIGKRRAEQHEELCRLETEPHRRWATGFCCLSFVMVAAPLAVWLRRAEFYTSFGVSFAFIMVVYYPLLMFTTSYSKNGALPAISLWLGNVVLLVPALYLWRKMVRY